MIESNDTSETSHGEVRENGTKGNPESVCSCTTKNDFNIKVINNKDSSKHQINNKERMNTLDVNLCKIRVTTKLYRFL